MKFWVPGPLPGLNEIVDAAKGCGGKGYGYAKMKEKWTNDVALHVLAAHVPKGKITRVKLHMHWFEKKHTNGTERDPDNIEAGQKFIWDGLVHAKVLPNDKRANNAGTTHECTYNAPVAGVEVTIEEVT